METLWNSMEATMTRKAVSTAIFAVCMLGATNTWAGSASIDALKGLARAYVEAQFSFDAGSIRRLTSQEFVEISPKGEVDERDEVIGFYAATTRTAAPPYQIQDQRVRVTGNLAVITQTVTIGTPPHSMSLAQTVTAARLGRDWKLMSSQSTPMPAPKP